MDLGLAGRTALVCGASRGIGFAVAQELVREGMRVAIVARRAEAVADAAARLDAHAPPGVAPTVPVVADLATADGLAHAIHVVRRELGEPDVLVTNTGGPPTGTATGHDWDAWQRATELLLRSAVELCRAFVPPMQSRGWGRVIGITSVAVKQPVASLVLSNTLRAGVTGYFKTLANEVAADGVTVNTVLPGYTATERLDELAAATVARTGGSPDDVFARWRADTPAGRIGTPEECAAAVAFLASTRAAFITGQALCVDGGAARGLL
jgi:3-oxoacyl-[acyl-carrier protein] reductase